MRNLLLCFTALLFAGCATPSGDSWRTRSADAQERARARAAKQVFAPNCPAPAHVAPQNCGLVVKRFAIDELSDFVARQCGGVESADCDAKLARTLEDRWASRYGKANRELLSTWCAENPAECQNFTIRELHWMNSHNEAVLKEYDVAKSEIKLRTKRTLIRQSRELREAGLYGKNDMGMAAGRAASQAAMDAATAASAASAAASVPMMMGP